MYFAFVYWHFCICLLTIFYLFFFSYMKYPQWTLFNFLRNCTLDVCKWFTISAGNLSSARSLLSRKTTQLEWPSLNIFSVCTMNSRQKGQGLRSSVSFEWGERGEFVHILLKRGISAKICPWGLFWENWNEKLVCRQMGGKMSVWWEIGNLDLGCNRSRRKKERKKEKWERKGGEK